MAAAITQTSRLMKFSSPLGEDTLLIESLEGSESISRLFEFHVELLAAIDTEIDPASMIGAKVGVTIALSDVKGSRYINGIVASFEQGAGDDEFNTYHARIVPGLWQATLNSNCRVFQTKSVLDIVKSVIGEYGLSVSDKTTVTYNPLDYCTQYSETDFHFVSRLLEESGISYWFDHSESDHTLVLSDSITAYDDCPLLSTIPYEDDSKGAEGAYGAAVTELSSTATMVSGKHATADFDFRQYQRVDANDVNSKSDFGENGFEQYLYPAGAEGYLRKADAPNLNAIESRFLTVRGIESDAVAEVFSGASNARSFCPGFAYTLEEHFRDAWNKRYLLTSVSHHASQVPSYRSKETAGGSYGNRFSSVDATIVFQPPRTTVKPVIFGPQTAKVVAPAGEDMAIDKLGRVCVQFFWDRLRNPNTMDNTWVRVAQQWAGSGWGTFFWPRIDDEVIVAFVNGDPDNPIVVGSVYNGVNVPKYQLPDHSTRSGLVTRSSKGGSGSTANELRFEDKTGNEQIFLNAEKDMDHRVENDHRMFIGGKDSLIVTANQLEQIGGDYNREIKGNSIEKIGGNSDIGIGGNLTEKVGGNLSLKIGGNQADKIGMNYSMDSGMEVYIKAGMSIVIESGLELTLKGAGGFINIGPAGVAISGTMVLINSGGAAGSGSAGSVSDPGSPTAPDTADDGTKGGKM